MSTLALREAEGEWCHQAQAGDLEGVEWVDTRLDPELAEGRQSRGADGSWRFRHRAVMRTLPPVIGEAAMEAQSEGTPTAWEGLTMVLARAEWLVRSRQHLWAPWSPVPRLLATLVETYGVESAIHRFDPERLSRLAALLPVWHTHRGTLERARELLSKVSDDDPLAAAASPEQVDLADAPRLAHEVMVVHKLSWWQHRAEDGAEASYRIVGGLLRFQPSSGPRFTMQREDVLFAWTPGTGLPHHELRLLPAWTVVRLASSTP